MEYEWDEAKRLRNRQSHGVDFAAAEAFDWRAVVEWEDRREEYGEQRLVAIAPIGKRLHVMVYTRRGENIRIISLRKANGKETKEYEKIKNQTALEG
jgi:uncharacterized DUF497 family protein